MSQMLTSWRLVVKSGVLMLRFSGEIQTFPARRSIIAGLVLVRDAVLLMSTGVRFSAGVEVLDDTAKLTRKFFFALTEPKVGSFRFVGVLWVLCIRSVS